MDLQQLLKENGLDYNQLKNNLKISYIRGSGKGGQKRNKTSSCCQLVDKFNYKNFIPKENLGKYNGKIVFTIDIGRNRLDNYDSAIKNWENKLFEMFFLKKERVIDEKKEKERKRKIIEREKSIKNRNKYKNRFYQ